MGLKPAAGVTFPLNLRSSQPSEWAEHTITFDAVNTPASPLTIEHGRAVMRGSGGTGTQSNRRSLYRIPDAPIGYSRIVSRWGGPQLSATQRPQRGHAHGLELGPDGKVRAAVIWHDIAFGAPYVFNLGVWEAFPDGTSSATITAPNVDTVAIVDGSRTANVVTVTVAAGHGYVAGDVVAVDVADATYDGTYVVSAVTATTISWPQTAANDASCGAGALTLATSTGQDADLVRSVAATDAVRASGVVTATVAAGHPFQVGDTIVVDLADATYDGNFTVTAVTATTVVWRQAVADDPSAGAGSIQKVFGYWLESEWWPGMLRCRAWPDYGWSGGAAGGRAISGPPPWESPWASTVDLTRIVGATEPTSGNLGQGLVAAHLAGGAAPTSVAYDNVTVSILGTR